MSARLLPAVAGAAGATGAFALGRRRSRAAERPHPDGPPLLIAHRGGAGLAPENTLAAFRQAVDAWGADMIELDVRASADGRCIVMHDATVDRTTDGTGAVASLTLAELRRLDAGHRFTPDFGRTHPYRDRGVRIPTIGEVLDALPSTRFIVEVKAAAAQRPLFEAIRRAGAEGRIIAASEHAADRTRFSDYPGPIGASTEQLVPFYILHRLHLSALWRPSFDTVELPEWWRGRRLLTPRLIKDFHAAGIPVHVWTINETGDMDRLLDWGVDGIETDRPDRLAAVLTRRGGRPPAPGGRRDME